MVTINNNFYDEMIKKNIGVYTREEQEKLLKSKIVILGLGGVGGTVATLCARSGVGYMSGVDPDTFEISNLNRQAFATIDSIGQSKSDAAKAGLLQINPHMHVNFQAIAIDEDNAEDIIRGHDVVIEALDHMPSRIVAHRAARKLGIPSVGMSGSPPHRGFVCTYMPAGVDYETAMSLPTHGLSMKDSSVLELVNNIKKRRAEHSVQYGAPQSWVDDYAAGKSGWIITPIRATLIAAFCAHETLQLLIGQKPLAIAPEGIFINLNNTENLVSIKSPEKGYWDAGTL